VLPRATAIPIPTKTPGSAVDIGPTTNAQGQATQDGPGVFTYQVQASDTVMAIAYRFGLCNVDVLRANRKLRDVNGLADGMELTLKWVPGSGHDAQECHTRVDG
jgi:hypothetical protein